MGLFTRRGYKLKKANTDPVEGNGNDNLTTDSVRYSSLSSMFTLPLKAKLEPMESATGGDSMYDTSTIRSVLRDRGMSEMNIESQQNSTIRGYDHTLSEKSSVGDCLTRMFNDPSKPVPGPLDNLSLDTMDLNAKAPSVGMSSLAYLNIMEALGAETQLDTQFESFQGYNCDSLTGLWFVFKEAPSNRLSLCLRLWNPDQVKKLNEEPPPELSQGCELYMCRYLEKPKGGRFMKASRLVVNIPHDDFDAFWKATNTALFSDLFEPPYTGEAVFATSWRVSRTDKSNYILTFWVQGQLNGKRSRLLAKTLSLNYPDSVRGTIVNCKLN